jgi:hypothetical protein
MGKKPFTTRMDEEVMMLAQRLAILERRSVTSLIEISVLEYAARRGVIPQPQDDKLIRSVSPQDDTATDGPRIKVPAPKKPGHANATRGKRPGGAKRAP